MQTRQERWAGEAVKLLAALAQNRAERAPDRRGWH